ncbi:MAG: AAA family ATPase [Desulfovibrionaceae bacterium]|nr:AAA family ATPase [Desulfovibrionaceae bacterium]
MSLQESNDINRIPYGLLEFSDIRKQNMIYVDKTKMIAELANQFTPLLFLRPKRFGKSLLVSTLKSLFSNGLEYFRGLEIEKIWKEKKYKVVHIDFSSIADSSAQEFERALGERIIEEFNVKGKVNLYDGSRVRFPDMILYDIVSELPDWSVVLLIDEYDAPLTHHLANPEEQDEITGIINSFLAVVKEYTGVFRLIFITGEVYAIPVSIFSGFNNYIDISLDADFNTILGFTQNELSQYFDPYIANAAQILNMSVDDIYKNLEKYYGGFKFSSDCEGFVYNPWSVLSFLKKSKDGFCNYWFDSGSVSSILMNYLKTHDDIDLLGYCKEPIFADNYELSMRYEVTNIPLDILLYQTGYLTIHPKSRVTNDLVVPNAEVEEGLSFLQRMANTMAVSPEK